MKAAVFIELEVNQIILHFMKFQTVEKNLEMMISQRKDFIQRLVDSYYISFDHMMMVVVVDQNLFQGLAAAFQMIIHLLFHLVY